MRCAKVRDRAFLNNRVPSSGVFVYNAVRKTAIGCGSINRSIERDTRFRTFVVVETKHLGTNGDRLRSQ